MSPEGIIFAIGKFPFLIFVALIAGDNNEDAVQLGATNGIQQVGRAGLAEKMVHNITTARLPAV